METTSDLKQIQEHARKQKERFQAWQHSYQVDKNYLAVRKAHQFTNSPNVAMSQTSLPSTHTLAAYLSLIQSGKPSSQSTERLTTQDTERSVTHVEHREHQRTRSGR
jgi:hypothetical protein